MSNTIFDLLPGSNNILPAGDVVHLNIKQEFKEEVNSIFEEMFNDTCASKKVKLSNEDKEEVFKNALDMLDGSIKSMTTNKMQYILDTDKITIDRIATDPENTNNYRLTDGVYRNVSVPKYEFENFFDQVILREGLETSVLYATLGKIQQNKFKEARKDVIEQLYGR